MKAKENTVQIPVVVHVVNNTATQNISDAQVQSQIAVLNADFRKLNVNFSSTPILIQSLAAVCMFQDTSQLKSPDRTHIFAYGAFPNSILESSGCSRISSQLDESNSVARITDSNMQLFPMLPSDKLHIESLVLI